MSFLVFDYMLFGVMLRIWFFPGYTRF